MDIDKEIIALISIREQGYVNDPSDRGGETRYGITEKKARKHGYKGPMCDLSLIFAKAIFKSDYWQLPKFHLAALHSEKIGAKLFDMGVICGVYFASHSLQRALNSLNNEEKYYLDIKVDGIIGSRTLDRVSRFVTLRGREGIGIMLKILNGLQVSRFMELSEHNKTQERFFYGWINKRID